MISISSNLNIMIKAAEKASKSVIRDFGEVEKLQVSKKGPYDFVTKTDKHVEKVLIEELSKIKKNYSFITEETGIIKNKDKENIWIIDPIDGTTNFLHGIPHFAICIALQYKNEIVSGLIFDPIKDEMFFAEKDKGAFLNNQRLRVSKKNSIDDCLFSSNHEGVKFSNLNMRYTGCAALDLAYVASGRLDGFFHNNINLWDVAAGEILVKEAGGIVNDIYKFDIDTTPGHLQNSTGKLAIRVSTHYHLKTLFEAFNNPIISTSANISGSDTINNIEEFKADFDFNDVAIYNKPLGNLSKPTPIIDLETKEVVRD